MLRVDMISFRAVFWLGFFGAILAAWWYLYAMATGMGVDLIGRPGPMAEAMRQMDPRMPMYMPMANFWPLFLMWSVMMAAMMLPTMVPTLQTYQGLMKSVRGNGAGFAGWVGVLAGYLIAWIGFAAVIAGAQLALLYGGVIDMLGIAKSPWVGGGLLIAVGAFQFTRAKEVCHGVCHSPMMYFIGKWRPGGLGGLRMGLGLGAFCVGCCWGFMALGFVGGVMSLLWMGLATLFMVLEKLPEIGHRVMKPMGVMLIAGGVVILAAPQLFYGG
ncbi:DUF2182 domain-containing protein [Shimia biformata]|uniref:DUF2182 domain-containing protein n=1 Tax=Shimia biformata TaxID=1294299 RepID=UPI001950ED71|nr:DUF2182 domain-containing protein [Shimia biformata]